MRQTLPIVVTALALWLSGCSSLPRERAASGDSTVVAQGVVIAAMGMLDVPYRAGGYTPAGFDCSGLVFFVYREAGMLVPRTTREQYREARPVAVDAVAPGDLVFFRLNSAEVSHVGIHVAEGRFIHAPSNGKRVSYANLADPYWRQRLVGAGRFADPVGVSVSMR